MTPVFPAVWPSPRGIAVLLALCGILAVASVVPGFVVALCAAAAVVAAFVAVDVARGPRSSTLAVRRGDHGFVALRRPAAFAYVVENRGPDAVRVGLIESPVPLVATGGEELVVDVPASSVVTSSMPFVPVERGTAQVGAVYCWAENGIGLLRRR